MQPVAAEYGNVPAVVGRAESGQEGDQRWPKGGLHGEPEQAEQRAAAETGDAAVPRQEAAPPQVNNAMLKKKVKEEKKRVITAHRTLI